MKNNRMSAIVAVLTLILTMAGIAGAQQSEPPVLQPRGQQGTQAGYPQNAPPDQGTQPVYTSQAPQYPPNVVPEGTSMLVRLTDTLDAAKMDRGKRFEGKLAQDVIGFDGTVLIPRGNRVRGHVSSVERGLHGRMLLSFDEIETRHGWIPLIATVTGVPGEHGVQQQTSSEGEISSRTVSPQRTVESAIAGAAIGAVAGGVAAGAHGAAIGAAAGGALGATAGILTDRNMKLQKNTVLEVRVDRQMVVPQS